MKKTREVRKGKEGERMNPGKTMGSDFINHGIWFVKKAVTSPVY